MLFRSPVSTSDYIEGDRTFATLANKTYHLRWNPTDGFTLEDLADSGYNPSVLAEADTAFDSSYDDMLICRVVTNASNVATITNLVNKVRMEAQVTRAPNTGDGGSTSSGGPTTVHAVDFARRPVANLEGVSPPALGRDTDATVRVTVRTRYGISVYSWSWNIDGAPHNSYGYTYNIVAG